MMELENNQNNKPSTKFSDNHKNDNLIQVLHVDDDINFLETSKQILEMNSQLKIDTATSVEDAYKKNSQKEYDVFISDYQMPGTNGLKFLKDLKDKNATSSLIIFTGKGREDVAIKALNLGAAYYISKHGNTETVFGELAHAIEQEVKRKKIQTQRDTLLNQLGERIKELNCLYQLTKLFEKKEEPLDKTLKQTIKLIPPAMQYPKASCTRIIFDKKEYKTSNYTKTKWTIQSKITVNKNKRGILEVSYLEEKPTSDEGPFLKEERNLIDSIAKMLAKVIADKKNQTALREKQKKNRQLIEQYRAILDSVPESIIITNLDGSIIDCNKSAIELGGYAYTKEILGKNILQLISSKDQKKAIETLQKILTSEKIVKTDLVALKRNKQTFTAQISGSIIKDSTNTKVGFVFTTRDITHTNEADHLDKKIIFEVRAHQLTSKNKDPMFS